MYQTQAFGVYFQSSEDLVDEELNMVITERLCVDDLVQIRAHQFCHQVAERGGREREREMRGGYGCGLTKITKSYRTTYTS